MSPEKDRISWRSNVGDFCLYSRQSLFKVWLEFFFTLKPTPPLSTGRLTQFIFSFKMVVVNFWACPFVPMSFYFDSITCSAYFLYFSIFLFSVWLFLDVSLWHDFICCHHITILYFSSFFSFLSCTRCGVLVLVVDYTFLLWHLDFLLHWLTIYR